MKKVYFFVTKFKCSSLYPLIMIIMVIESRNSVNSHYFDTKSLIWSQIFFENLSISIAMNIGKIKFPQFNFA